jgi:hypothetical protein
MIFELLEHLNAYHVVRLNTIVLPNSLGAESL